MTLRSTRLRDVNGTVWHVPNGTIQRVANKSQQWSRAVLDLAVAYDTDVRRASEVIKRVADEMATEEAWSSCILEDPEVWGVESAGPEGVVIRLVVKTVPAERLNVLREMRIRVKDAFAAEGIAIPSAVWPGPTPGRA